MKKSRFIFRILLLGVVLFTAINIISLQFKIKDLKAEKDKLFSALEEYQLTIAELEDALSLPKEDYVEKYAREVLGYHKHSDIIFREKTN